MASIVHRHESQCCWKTTIRGDKTHVKHLFTNFILIHCLSQLTMISTGNLIVIYLFTSAVFYEEEIGHTKFNKKMTTTEDEFDFIIIGGGTAGSLIASKLSAEKGLKVLLLEKSGSGNDFTDIGLYSNYFQDPAIGYRGPGLVKSYNTTKQRFACRGSGHVCSLRTGNALGGGGNFNGLYTRGSPLDYDEWQNRFGAKGWSYDDVLPFFKKTEKCVNKTLAANGYHGTHGEQFVSNKIGFKTIASRLQSAAEENGFIVNSDYNNPQFTNSFDFVQSYVYKGYNQNSRRAFLRRAYKRPNLKIICFAAVTKILFDCKKAVGVQYYHDGDNHKAKVQKLIHKSCSKRKFWDFSEKFVYFFHLLY